MIKVLVPRMPSADEIMPYLRRIDETRVYVNDGPLVKELEARLEAICCAPCVAVASGTSALELALQLYSMDLDQHMCIMPALTFAATGLAALRARYLVSLSDVASDTWQMPAPSIPYTVYVPVATFGVPVRLTQWEELGVPIVIDAAGAFPAQEVSTDPNIITCFSLHATKAIGCGEGGFVATHNADAVARIRDLRNFGCNGTNVKMSEYHAAVGLASLSKYAPYSHGWIADSYAEQLDLQVRASHTICNVLLPDGLLAADVACKLKERGVETKQWYRPYLNERSDFSRPVLRVTDMLRDRLLGLPYHAFLTRPDVNYVCSALKECL